jgi:hypothetical protein
MISTVAALALLTSSNSQVQGQPAAQPAGQLPSAAALISEMMAKYAAAPTLNGTVESIIQNGKDSVKLSSYIQYDRSKQRLYIRQVKEGGRKGQTVLVSDGARFMYANPMSGKGHRDRVPYLVENAVRREATMTPEGPRVVETPMNVGEIYIAGSLGLFDRNVPIDMAIARLEDLQFFRGQLVSFVNKGLEEFNGAKAYKISGQWKAYASAQNAQGEYDIFITPEKDLVGYRTFETFALKEGVFRIISSWLCNFKVGGTPDPKLFTVK